MPANPSDEAAAFLIWRKGHALNWDCTITEIAEATGFSKNKVRSICNNRAWPVADYIEPPARAIPVDQEMEARA